nr:hypothetical protein [uncultured Carboxylicivirga sp.]
MKKILLLLAVGAMVLSSCGQKSTAQSEAATEETTVVEAAPVETAVPDSTDKACCEKDSTMACCQKDSLKADEAETPEAVTEEAE